MTFYNSRGGRGGLISPRAGADSPGLGRLIVWSEAIVPNTLRGFRVPTIRRRFVSRARYLTTYPPFLKAMAAEAARWDADYPEYAIGRRGYPSESVGHPANDEAIPPALQIAISAADAAGEYSGPSFTAFYDWQRRVYAVCLAWWPPADFPNWLAYRHANLPARFASTCIICDPKYVDPELIRKFGVTVAQHAYDPTDSINNPREIFWRVLYRRTLELIAAHVQTGRALTADDLPTITDSALPDAYEAEDKYRQQNPPPGGWWAYAYIFPGMKGEDWDALKERALEAAREGEDQLHARATEMLDDGKSIREVAGALGLSRAFVAQLRDRPGRE